MNWKPRKKKKDPWPIDYLVEEVRKEREFGGGGEYRGLTFRFLRVPDSSRFAIGFARRRQTDEGKKRGGGVEQQLGDMRAGFRVDLDQPVLMTTDPDGSVESRTGNSRAPKNFNLILYTYI